MKVSWVKRDVRCSPVPSAMPLPPILWLSVTFAIQQMLNSILGRLGGRTRKEKKGKNKAKVSFRHCDSGSKLVILMKLSVCGQD